MGDHLRTLLGRKSVSGSFGEDLDYLDASLDFEGAADRLDMAVGCLLEIDGVGDLDRVLGRVVFQAPHGAREVQSRSRVQNHHERNRVAVGLQSGLDYLQNVLYHALLVLRASLSCSSERGVDGEHWVAPYFNVPLSRNSKHLGNHLEVAHSRV